MINTTIGKYKLIRLIGEGGMASVYEAEHELLGTKVAVKVLNPILSANAQIRERFINEAKLMASLDHPNITKVIDFDDQAQQLSIVMEYLSGEDLNDKIKRNGPLSENEITDIFKQTLSAFQYAHEKGIVHRDIKPSNIFVLQNGFVKILDFGIAKLFGQGNEMTQTGMQMGTPIYMSPEQVKGDKSIDFRSDIYSLGVTIFFAINGKPPYNADTESQFDIFTKIVHETLPEFTVSSKFNDLVLKACQKNREERFQSCDEMIQKLTIQNVSAVNERTNKEHPIVNVKEKSKPSRKNTVYLFLKVIDCLASVLFLLFCILLPNEGMWDTYEGSNIFMTETAAIGTFILLGGSLLIEFIFLQSKITKKLSWLLIIAIVSLLIWNTMMIESPGHIDFREVSIAWFSVGLLLLSVCIVQIRILIKMKKS